MAPLHTISLKFAFQSVMYREYYEVLTNQNQVFSTATLKLSPIYTQTSLLVDNKRN